MYSNKTGGTRNLKKGQLPAPTTKSEVRIESANEEDSNKSGAQRYRKVCFFDLKDAFERDIRRDNETTRAPDGSNLILRGGSSDWLFCDAVQERTIPVLGSPVLGPDSAWSFVLEDGTCVVWGMNYITKHGATYSETHYLNRVVDQAWSDGARIVTLRDGRRVQNDAVTNRWILLTQSGSECELDGAPLVDHNTGTVVFKLAGECISLK